MYRENPRSKAWESTVRKTQLQRRSCSFFAPMSVAPLDEDLATPGNDTNAGGDAADLCHVERLLSTGDFYTGLWYNDRPHGTGKYLWTDGCMYEGDWNNGWMTGKGKFSWPSGATYEGDFNGGFLDGYGTFTGASGDTYRGTYSMNLKHGHGARIYVNGDCYDGEWRFGVHDGQGRYTWNNGHEYNGGWKGGVLSGKGLLVWTNGNCYDGEWEEGAPCGKGHFRWSDGSAYVGVWSKDPSVRKGVFFPSASSASPGNLPRDPQDALAVDLDQCKICSGENVSILPSQKVFGWAGAEAEQLQVKPGARRSMSKAMDDATLRRWTSIESERRSTASNNNGSTGRSFNRTCVWQADGDITCDIVEANGIVAAVASGGDPTTPDPILATRVDDTDPNVGRSPVAKWVPKEVKKKQGETISKGHKNYELMLNLQLGIRHSVGRPAPATSLDLKASAFDPKEKLWTKFPPEGSKYTPPHQSCDFKWKDYCPVVFRTLRRLFKVDPADYMISICGNDALRELSSPGKSGSFFYLTHDDRYMIKTMKKSEVKVLLKMLPAYYNHVRSFENTLVTKFFGLHCVKLTGATQKKVRFVIMGNLFCSEYIIHRRFDLKGSSHGRTTSKPEDEIDANTTLKDLDLNFIFRLQRSWFQEFYRQVDRDCEFLEQEKIMDYSLLVGIHFRDTSFSRDQFLSEGSSDTSNMSEGTPCLSSVDMDHMIADPNKWASIKLGINMPCQVEHTVRKSDCDAQLVGDPTGELYDVVLFFGIIDILQDYDISKKLEHAYKSIQYDPTSISAVDPRQYSRRFRDFIFKVFAEDTKDLII